MRSGFCCNRLSVLRCKPDRGLIRVTKASAARTDSSLPEATSPPPTIRMRLPLSCHARRRDAEGMVSSRRVSTGPGGKTARTRTSGSREDRVMYRQWIRPARAAATFFVSTHSFIFYRSVPFEAQPVSVSSIFLRRRELEAFLSLHLFDAELFILSRSHSSP